jgi:integrase/recombinase XerD
MDDRRFKNTTKTNIKNYEMLLGKFVDYCIENQLVNVEDFTYIAEGARDSLVIGIK